MRSELARGANEKSGDSFEPSQPQPEAAEVESARLLAGQAREELVARGLSDERVREVADRYVSEDHGGDLDAFIEWAAGEDADDA